MPRSCKVCSHDEVKSIDKAIVSGESLRKIAERYDIHYSTICRHKQHLASKIQAASVITAAREGLSVMQQVSDFMQKAHDLLNTAEQANDTKTAIQAVRECRSCLELMARISGELSPEKIQIMIAPVVNSVVQVLRAEIHDPDTLQRIRDRLLSIDV